MKKLQPIDSLTEQDKYNFRKYLFLYANCNCGPIDVVLQEWNKSKRRLYRAFGNKLIIKKEITLPQIDSIFEKQLMDIYSFSIFESLTTHTLLNQNNFYADFMLHIMQYTDLSYIEKKCISELFRYKYIVKGYVDYSFKLDNYSFSVRNGAKTIRTIQKCIKALGYKNIELFNKWRNDINTVNSNKILKANLVLSINPVDFITMSDNQCNWSSCMSWINDGCYHAGTIEMMNSNLAVVAYLEANKSFEIVLDEDNILNMSNKTWRSLIFCHKDIIIAGKSYPYYNEFISKEAIKFMRETVKKTLNWDYQFKEQLYGDIKNFHNNDFLKNACDPTYHSNRRKIIIYTKGMYNDFIEDTGSQYWCCRNCVKNGLRLCLSGKHTCMCCGKVINEDYEIFNSKPDDIGRIKICDDCKKDKKCPICGTINYSTDNKYHLCTEECKKDALIFPGQNRVISKTEFLSYSDISVFIVCKNEEIENKLFCRVKENTYPSFAITKEIELDAESLGFIKGTDYIIKQIPQVYIDNFSSIGRGYYNKINIYNHCTYSSRNNIVFSSYIKEKKSFLFYDNQSNGYVFSKIAKEMIRVMKEVDNFHYYNEGRS